MSGSIESPFLDQCSEIAAHLDGKPSQTLTYTRFQFYVSGRIGRLCLVQCSDSVVQPAAHGCATTLAHQPCVHVLCECSFVSLQTSVICPSFLADVCCLPICRLKTATTLHAVVSLPMHCKLVDDVVYTVTPSGTHPYM